MSKVVVTGAAGFIGTHLVERLPYEGHEVLAVVRRADQAARLMALGIETRLADVTEKETLRGPLEGAAVVYHLAGRIHANTLDEFRAVNVAGVHNVAQTCAELPAPPTLIVVSSLAAAGPAEKGRPRTEADPSAPISHYGQSKLEGESVAYRWAGEVPISIVRPPFVFGGGDRVSLLAFRMIHRWGLQVIPRGHDLELSLIHVEDFVRAVLSIARGGRRIQAVQTADSSSSSAANSLGIYNPADPCVITFSQMGRLIGEVMGRSVRVWRVRRPLLWGACAINSALTRVTGRTGIINFDKLREAAAPAWTCSNQRCQAELSFSPAAPLETRLAETAAWYKREGWL